MVVLSVKVTLVLDLHFDASHGCSAEEIDFFIKKWKRNIATPLCIPFVSHANLKFHRNPMIEIGSK